MKCNKHFTTDLTSINGVCSTCLTERLIIVIEAQTKVNLELKLAGKTDRNFTGSETETPDKICVSPSLNCKKAENVNENENVVVSLSDTNKIHKNKKKFSIVSSLFRFVKPGHEMDPDPKSEYLDPRKPKKKKCIFNSDASRVMQRPCKGMSPADESDGEVNSPGSTPQWRETPSRMNTPMHIRCKRMNQARNLTGFAFCLSPMVRRESQVAGDVRVPVKPHIGDAAAFCANRSKKLANCGRFRPNY